MRLYTLSLPIEGGKLGTPRFDRQVNLLDTDGAPYAPRASDTESVRWTPDRDGFIYTSEGEEKIGRPGFIRQSTLDGRYVKDLPIPDAYTSCLDTSSKLVSGVGDNIGFGSMELVSWVKQWRGLATRYDKLALTYHAGVLLSAIGTWLKRLAD
ncbi:hypothetical protein RE9425_03230 [Prescottella equi]|nr:hypothetical protein RE9425_03230 [Prescottella equi]